MKITQPTTPRAEYFEVLKLGLNSFNESFAGKLQREDVASFLENDSGKIVGGILGEIKWGWLYVEGLWVDANYRLGHWGTKLLKTLEDFSLSKGITNFRLETTSFQALGFYQKAGYRIFGELPDMPPGHKSYFLKKQLNILDG